MEAVPFSAILLFSWNFKQYLIVRERSANMIHKQHRYIIISRDKSYLTISASQILTQSSCVFPQPIVVKTVCVPQVTEFCPHFSYAQSCIINSQVLPLKAIQYTSFNQPCPRYRIPVSQTANSKTLLTIT